MNKQFESLKISLNKYIQYINVHQVFIVLLIASSVLVFTLVQSKTYLDPARDEAKYNEEVLKINYATIDQQVVDDISSTLDDQDINVDPNFVPGRSNPFAE